MPIEQLGRIRGKNIGDGEISSRNIATDLQSDNYDPGFSGWLISRVSGNVEFNEGTFRGNVAISGNLEVSGENGILIKDGGDLTVESGGDIIINGGQLTAGPVALSSSGLTVGSVPVVLNSSGLDIGSGLTQIDSTGVRVGSDVEIDSTGLKIDGVLQEAGLVGDALARGGDSVQDASLSTSQTEIMSVTVTPPSWAETMILIGIARCQITETTASKNLETRWRINGGSTFSLLTNGLTTSPATRGFSHHTFIDEGSVSLPTAFDLEFVVRVNTGTNSTNNFAMSVVALFGKA